MQLEWKRLTVSDLITIGLLVISILGGAWGLRDKVEEMSQDHHQMLKLLEDEQRIVAGVRDQQRDQARLLREFPPHRHAGDGEHLDRKDLIYPNDLPIVPAHGQYGRRGASPLAVSTEASRSDAIEGLARLGSPGEPGE